MPIVLGDTSGLAQGISTAGGALATALEKRAENRLLGQQKAREKQQQQKGMEAITKWSSNYDPSKSPMENIGSLQAVLEQEDIDPAIIQPILQDVLKKAVSQQGDQYGAAQIFGDRQSGPSQPDPSQEIVPVEEGGAQEPVDNMAKFSNEDLVRMSSDPNRIVSQRSKSELEKRKLQQSIDKDERDWHTKFSIDQEKKVAALRESIPKKTSALAHAKSAVLSDETGLMSGTWWADKTGIEAFRGVEGAQLEVAAKEHFFGNMSRVSAKAQNIFFEKLLKGMFSQVGQTKETAMTFIEMLQGELNMDEAYMKAFDRITEEDEKIWGYSRKDADRRARQEVEHMEDLNLNRTLYRVQQLKEAQVSDKQASKDLLKSVPQGTPLTLEKKFMFMDRFDGDASTAIAEAKKAGYTIPSGGNVRLYSMPNQQFTKIMRGE